MKTKINLLAVGLFVLVLSFVSTNINLFAQSEEEVTIEGIVSAVEWDEDDNVTAVAISVTIIPEDTTEEQYTEEYLVANNKKGRELLELVGETVKATGTVETDEEGYMTIYVTDYAAIKEVPEEQEPEEQEPEEIEPPEK